VLLIITSTADDLSGVPTSMTLNDLEIKIAAYSAFFVISGSNARLNSEFWPKLLEID